MQTRDVGVDVGAEDSTGARDGSAVGPSVELGVDVGAEDSTGARDGSAVGPSVELGIDVGPRVVGFRVGRRVEGTSVGMLVGTPVGFLDGTSVNATAGPVAESVGPLCSPRPVGPAGPVSPVGPNVPMDELVCVVLGITTVLAGRLWLVVPDRPIEAVRPFGPLAIVLLESPESASWPPPVGPQVPSELLASGPKPSSVRPEGPADVVAVLKGPRGPVGVAIRVDDVVESMKPVGPEGLVASDGLLVPNVGDWVGMGSVGDDVDGDSVKLQPKQLRWQNKDTTGLLQLPSSIWSWHQPPVVRSRKLGSSQRLVGEPVGPDVVGDTVGAPVGVLVTLQPAQVRGQRSATTSSIPQLSRYD